MHRLHNIAVILAFQRRHTGDEDDGVEECADGLVEEEFYERVKFVERFAGDDFFGWGCAGGLFIGNGHDGGCDGGAGECFFEELLPEKVWGCVQEGEEGEVEERCWVECEWCLLRNIWVSMIVDEERDRETQRKHIPHYANS